MRHTSRPTCWSTFLGKWFAESTARVLLLHTLAHILIRQTGLRVGYSSASLRERSTRAPRRRRADQPGYSIYTAAGDVEGTLGGLAGSANHARFAPHSAQRLARFGVVLPRIPLCRESPRAGFEVAEPRGLPRLRPHLRDEFAHANALLDRTTVVGTPESSRGYFSEPLEQALQLTAEALKP